MNSLPVGCSAMMLAAWLALAGCEPATVTMTDLADRVGKEDAVLLAGLRADIAPLLARMQESGSAHAGRTMPGYDLRDGGMRYFVTEQTGKMERLPQRIYEVYAEENVYRYALAAIERISRTGRPEEPFEAEVHFSVIARVRCCRPLRFVQEPAPPPGSRLATAEEREGWVGEGPASRHAGDGRWYGARPGVRPASLPLPLPVPFDPSAVRLVGLPDAAKPLLDRAGADCLASEPDETTSAYAVVFRYSRTAKAWLPVGRGRRIDERNRDSSALDGYGLRPEDAARLQEGGTTERTLLRRMQAAGQD